MSDCQTRSPPYRVLPRFHVGALATVAHTVTGPDDENRTFWPLHVQTRCRAPGEPENDIRLFLDSTTTPICRRGEPMLDDPTFAVVAPWVGRQEILRPGEAEITERLSEFDVAVAIDLGPTLR